STWVGGGTAPCNPRRWGGQAILRDLSTGRAGVLPIEPVSEIENPSTCGWHLRVALCAGTTRHGDQQLRPRGLLAEVFRAPDCATGSLWRSGAPSPRQWRERLPVA